MKQPTLRPNKGSLRLNLATLEDHSRLVEMSLNFFNASEYKKFGVSEDRVSELVTSFLNADRKEKLCIVLRDEDFPVGMLAVLSATNIFNNEKSCIELVWWIEPEYRGYKAASDMLDLYEYWARTVVKAQVIQMVALDDKLDNLYKRRKFTRSEMTYTKDLRI